MPLPRTIRYHRLLTEQCDPARRALDRLSTVELLRCMHREDARAVRAVGRVVPQIARAAAAMAAALRRGGRLILVGAGTSGRLGVLEAAECPPTFSTAPMLVQAFIAGGRAAVFRSEEGAEDRVDDGERMTQRAVRRGDIVIGLTASGVTPFVDGALRAAVRRGARTVLITANPRPSIRASIRIACPVGPELLAGSTRLKAGTATKLILNMLTLATMTRLGKTHGPWMVDVRPTSRKLRARAIRLIQTVVGCSAGRAETALERAGGRAKVAVLMLTHSLSPRAARRRLARTDGSLREALQALPDRTSAERRR